MEFISEILTANIHIDFVIVSLVVAAGYFQKRYWISKVPSQALKTLIIGTAFSLIYLALTLDLTSFQAIREGLISGFVSYALATSFYELLVKHVVDLVIGFFNRK